MSKLEYGKSEGNRTFSGFFLDENGLGPCKKEEKREGRDYVRILTIERE